MTFLSGFSNGLQSAYDRQAPQRARIAQANPVQMAVQQAVAARPQQPVHARMLASTNPISQAVGAAIQRRSQQQGAQPAQGGQPNRVSTMARMLMGR